MRNPTRPFRPVAMAAALAAAGLFAAPLSAHAQAAAQAQSIDIPAQPADQALQRFVELTKFQLIYAPEVVRGLTSKPVSGVLQPREALAKMLEGTGVQIVDTGAGAATLRPPHAAAAAGDSAAAELQTVTVTARKSTERMLDVPIAVTAITGESLRRRGASSVADVLQDAPGVAALPSGVGLTTIAIRGISTSLGGNENGYYLDDLPFTGVTVPISPDVRAWDIERIEILRGPQGTLFGEGSMGGTVRILTNDARLGEFSFAGQLGGSTTQGGGPSNAIKAMINVPLGEKIAVRVGATHEELSGWIDDPATRRTDVNGSRVDTGRIRVRFDPTDRLKLNASYWSYDAKWGLGNATTDQGTLPQSASLNTSTRYTVNGLTALYDFDTVSLFYGYSKNRFHVPQEGPLFGGTLTAAIDIDVAAHELRAAPNTSGPLKWTAGLYRRESKRSDLVQFPLFAIDNVSNTESVASSVFAEASYSLPGVPVELTAGVRRFRDHLTNQDFNSSVPTPLADFTFTSTNPRLSIAWHPSRDLQVYTSASKGFRSGQVQPSTSVALAGVIGMNLPPSLKPDSIWTYELGTKATLLDKRMTVEAAVYHSDWKDVTVRIPIGTTGFNGLINSNGTKTDGIEANVALDVTHALSLSLGGSYNNARYSADVPGTGIVKGSKVDNVPSTTISGSAEYRFPAFAASQGAARLGFQRSSARDAPSFPQNRSGDAINNVNARLSFEHAGWTISLYGENLTNDSGAISARTVQPISPGVDDVYANRLRPRTFGVDLRYAMGR